VIFTRRLALLALLSCVYASAQKLTLDRPQTKNIVSYLAEPAMVEAGTPADVELAFRIADGVHINSHSPADSEMIPTTLMLQPVAGVKLGRTQYPVGTKYAFSFAPGNKLNVYSGDFVVMARVTVAQAGSYTLKGLLDYQACDNLQCYPVKTLPVTLVLIAK
jgi:hypothetical protein